MKAIFSNFGRRANVDRRESSAEPSNHIKIASPTSSRHAPRHQATYSSLDTASGGIGDAPVKSSDLSRSDRASKSAGHGPSSSAWASKLSGSLRGVPGRNRASEADDAALVREAIPSPSNRPLHPPSSYREPAPQIQHANRTTRGLARKISAASRKGTSLSRGQPAETTAPAISASHLRQLPSAPDLDGARHEQTSPYQTTRPAAILNPSLPAPTAESFNINHTVSTNADVSAMTSAELATRLNELAVANADGLLTDDEYRTLRQAVFDRMVHDDKQPITRSAASGLTIGANSESAASSHAPPSSSLLAVGRSMSSPGHADQTPSSIRSGRSGKASSFQNVTDLFRKSGAGSRTMHSQASQDSHSSHELNNQDPSSRALPRRGDSEGMSSQLSSGDGQSQRALSFRTQQSSAAKSSRASTFGRLRAGSQVRRAQAETAARELEDAFSVERTARSLRAVSIYDTCSAEGSNWNSATTIDRSPTSLRADMAPSTMFGAEYVDKSSSEILAEIAVVQAEGNRMLATFSTLEETLHAKYQALESSVARGVVERVRETNSLACITHLESVGREASGIRAQRPPPPSSYRVPRQPSQSSASYSLDAPREGVAFEAELTSIYTQKAAVVKRYQDRLAFLQSKLRSAAIREGLK